MIINVYRMEDEQVYILVESSKERYEEGIDTTVLSVSESKELLARHLEKEIRDKLVDLPEKFSKQALEDFEKIKKGSPYNGIQIDDDEYIQLHFEGELLVLYTTGCPLAREYAGETKQILEIKSTDVIDEFREAYGFLSNFYLCDLDYGGNNYCCVESAYQAMKETNPAERGNYSHLYPSEAKKKGKSCNLRPDWEEVKVDVMYDILKAKFSDEDLKARLLLTGNKELIESNRWHDNFWGNCVCKKCEAIEGKNMLGTLLMRLRKEL